MIVHALAPAKLNLGLEVLGKREDGFHEIRTIFAAVSLFDRLDVSDRGSPGVEVSGTPETIEGNLVSRAVDSLRAKYPAIDPAIRLTKRIPISAGLGGGSSDAAAALLACVRCYGIESVEADLPAYAAELGSDVPFFLSGGLALASGRGEMLTPLPSPPRMFAVIVAPRISIPAKTASLYRALEPPDLSDGSLIKSSAREGFSESIDPERLRNAFARALYAMYPSLSELPAMLMRLGATAVGLSGAGPAHYALERDLARAQSLARRVRAEVRESAAVHLVRLLPQGVMLTSEP